MNPNPKFSRLRILGRPDFQTPFCVLRCVCRAHQIPFDEEMEHEELLDLIFKKPYLTENTVETLSAFLNPDILWTRDQLKIGMKKILEWNTSFELPEKIEIGFITPQNLDVCDATILYRLCRKFKIQTFRETTEEQMKFSLELFSDKEKEKYLQTLLQKKFETLPYEKLLSLANFLSISGFPKYQRTDLLQFLSRDSSFFEEIAKPQDHCEAVFFVALKYRKDFSESHSPYEEYLHLEKVGISKFVPQDPHFLQKWQKNPHLYSLEKTFCSLFPRSFYASFKIFYREMFDPLENERIDLYEFLLETIRHESFYSLSQCREFPEQTSILSHTLKEFDDPQERKIRQTAFVTRKQQGIFFTKPQREKFLAYGFWGSPTLLFSIDELFSMFNRNRGFQNEVHSLVPKDTFFGNPNSLTFSSTSIRKLSKILSERQSAECQQLKIRIEEIIKFQKSLTEESEKVRKRYFSETHEFQLEVQKSLLHLFRLSMFMRGWKDGEPYPLSANQTITDADRFNEISVSITTEIRRIERIFKVPAGQFLFESRLMEFANLDYKIHPSNLTLIEKIRLLKQENEESSCIRTSSNYLLASETFYCCLFQLPQKIPIQEMRFIA